MKVYALVNIDEHGAHYLDPLYTTQEEAIRVMDIMNKTAPPIVKNHPEWGRSTYGIREFTVVDREKRKL